MSTGSGTRDYGRFDELAEEFAQRYRRGERPSLEEYIDRLPEMADEIREMFPALVEVEQVEKDARDDPIHPSPAVLRLRQVGVSMPWSEDSPRGRGDRPPEAASIPDWDRARSRRRRSSMMTASSPWPSMNCMA